MQQIKIKIKPDGTIEAETFGIKGKKCLDYIREIERMANAVADDSDFKPEYYETPVEHTAENVETEEVLA